MKLFQRKWVKPLFLTLTIPGLVVALDLIIRGSAIVKMPLDFKLYYALSVFCGIFIWHAALSFIKQVSEYSRGAGLIFAGGLSAVYTLIILGSFGFYSYFSVLPNMFAFEYFLDEPWDCWLYAKAALKLWHAGGFLAIVVALTMYIMRISHHEAVVYSAKRGVIYGVSCLIFAAFFHNNVRMGPNAFTPGIHTVFSLSKAVEYAASGRGKVQVLGAGVRSPVSIKLGKLPSNVLLILNESIRAQNQSAFGYHLNTTPKLSKFFANRSANVVRFDRAYANATRTMLAFPSFFTGVVPSQAGGLMHTVPLVFDYGRAFDEVETFLISTQSMRWGNFDEFLNLKQLDFSWYKEVAPAEINAGEDRFESLDDALIPEVLAHFLEAPRSKQKFFGVIQLTGTHAPYRFDAASELFKGEGLLDDYNSSLHYHDRQVGQILSLLEKHGVLQDTLIISSSDHGEAFGEHGYSGHLNTFYDEEAKVPLWLHLPDRLARDPQLMQHLRDNATQPVSNADVIPTLLSLLAPQRQKEMAPLLSNLLGFPLNQPLPQGRVILMQNYNDIDQKTMFVGVGAVVGPYKYLLKFNQARGEEELYDLRDDPLERRNIWGNASNTLKRLIYTQILEQKNSAALFRKAFPEYTGDLDKLIPPELDFSSLDSREKTDPAPQ